MSKIDRHIQHIPSYERHCQVHQSILVIHLLGAKNIRLFRLMASLLPWSPKGRRRRRQGADWIIIGTACPGMISTDNESLVPNLVPTTSSKLMTRSNAACPGSNSEMIIWRFPASIAGTNTHTHNYTEMASFRGFGRTGVVKSLNISTWGGFQSAGKRVELSWSRVNHDPILILLFTI